VATSWTGRRDPAHDCIRLLILEAAVDALRWALAYSNLELDLETGRRGERAALVSGLLPRSSRATPRSCQQLRRAVLLALTRAVQGQRGDRVAGPAGRDCGFVSDAGRDAAVRARGMVEVGTTNRNSRRRLRARPVTPRTAVLLPCTPPNFRVTGFTGIGHAQPDVGNCKRHELLLIDASAAGATEAIADGHGR